MAGLLALAYVIALVIAGAQGAPWWLVLAAAVVGTMIYVMMRSTVFMRAAREGQSVVMIAVANVTQAVTAAALFGIGRLIGAAF